MYINIYIDHVFLNIHEYALLIKGLLISNKLLEANKCRSYYACNLVICIPYTMHLYIAVRSYYACNLVVCILYTMHLYIAVRSYYACNLVICILYTNDVIEKAFLPMSISI